MVAPYMLMYLNFDTVGNYISTCVPEVFSQSAALDAEEFRVKDESTNKVLKTHEVIVRVTLGQFPAMCLAQAL